MTLQITKDIAIPEEELEEQFIRASGPGGQHVNKAATAVQLRFDVESSPSLPEAVRRRLKSLAGNRLTKEGVLILEASQHRSRQMNRDDARERFTRLVRRAARPPARRKKTRPTRASKERRLQNKRERSEKKRRRKPPGLEF
ncbi:MAG: alternative ribosome rescue aminoacyl-tRNA hydrolase ArfB [Anaerolineales bacterium]|nr:alternative ribosome rescue aminoacyl-tRNA hydrolase ArfB [Anaerolineales bacterium]